MRRASMLLVGLVAGTGALAQGEWTDYASGRNGEMYSVHLGRLKKLGEGQWQVWTRKTVKTPLPVYSNRKGGPMYAELIQHQVIHCPDRTLRVVGTFYYNKVGAILEQDTTAGSADVVVPGSVGEILVEVICE